jgi:hypothetical protein
MHRAPWLVVLGLFALAGACKSDPPAERTKRPVWLLAAKIETLGVGEAFAKNSEVFLNIENPTDEPLVIQALGSEGAATLVHAGGARAKIHRLSVGVAKPVLVPPRGHKRTSLLFESAQGAPEKLYLYDKEFAVSVRPASASKAQ